MDKRYASFGVMSNWTKYVNWDYVAILLVNSISTMHGLYVHIGALDIYRITWICICSDETMWMTRFEACDKYWYVWHRFIVWFINRRHTFRTDDYVFSGTKAERGFLAFNQLQDIKESADGADVDDAIKRTYDIPLISNALRRNKCCSYVPFAPSYVERPCKKCCRRPNVYQVESMHSSSSEHHNT
jgi:hypothetical protein